MKVGVIGIGLMGAAMARRLLEVQVSLLLYNRTVEKLEPLQGLGAEVCMTPVALLQAADCVLVMLTDAAAIQAVLLEAPTRTALAGRTVIQMGTIAPAESQAIAAAVVEAGGTYLEAPVLGSISEAQAGTLQIMVGAESEVVDRDWSILQHLGSPRLIGPVGTAAALKLALNQLIGSLTTAFAQSLGLVQRQGVEVETFMAILRQSALYAPTFDKKLQRMVDRHFEQPNFPTKHLLKDMNLFLEAARSANVQVASVEGVCEILTEAIQMGLADADYSALFAAVNPLAQEP